MFYRAHIPFVIVFLLFVVALVIYSLCFESKGRTR